MQYPGGRNFMLSQYAIIALSMGIGLVIIWISPFPIGFLSSLAIMFLTMMYIRRRLLRKLGVIGSGSGSPFSFGKLGFSGSNFECMGCGHKHKQRACPKCGSKMRRLGV